MTPLLAVFQLVLFMIVPRGPPVHYYVLCAIQKVHFIITLVSLGSQNERYNEVAVYMNECCCRRMRLGAIWRQPIDSSIVCSV